MGPYQYEALDVSRRLIRLIRIDRLAAAGIVHTSMHTVRLGEHDHAIECLPDRSEIRVTYLALAYQWGPADQHASIMVNGAQMAVRRNLWLFLMHCASTAALAMINLEIWIDALRIDQ